MNECIKITPSSTTPFFFYLSLSYLPGSITLVFPAEEYPFERLAELRAEDGVDDGVEGGVEVPEPEEDGEHDIGEVTGGADGH